MKRSLVLFFALLFLVAGCGDDDDNGSDDDDRDDPEVEAVELDEDDTTAIVSVGDRVEVELDENASVGDDWEIDVEPDPDVLELVDESFELEGEEDCAGCGGTLTFTFEAVGEGETSFTIANCFRCTAEGEPSEEPPPPAEIEFAVEVTG